MNRSQLFLLGKHLSQYITFEDDDEPNGCDHTFTRTLAWIKHHNLDQETCLGWLQQRGGWCDCTVVLDVLLAEPSEVGENTLPVPLTAFKSWSREW